MTLLNQDIYIFLAFLLLNLAVGLYYGRGVKTLREYAVGTKGEFSTFVLAMTIVATRMSGSYFIFIIQGVYVWKFGGVWGVICSFIALYLLSRLALSSGALLKHTSVAGAMRSHYGPQVGMLTALSAVAMSIGIVSMQFSVISKVLSTLLYIDSNYIAVLACLIIITYSSLGGIRAVTFSDVLQFGIFAIALPLLIITIIRNFSTTATLALPTIVQETFAGKSYLTQNPTQLFRVLSVFAITLSVPFVQRMQMARDPYQMKKSFTYAAALWAVVVSLIILIGILFKAAHPHIPKQESALHMLTYMIKVYNIPGLRIFIALAIMCMVLSTADSYLNATSVVFVDAFSGPAVAHDKQLLCVRIVNICLGLAALLIVFTTHFDDRKFIYAYGNAIMQVPLLLMLLGFRTTQRAALSGMGAGCLAILTFLIVPSLRQAHGNHIALSGIFANLLTLLSFHYLLGEPGGWVGVKEKAPLLQQRRLRTHRWMRLKEQWAVFSLYRYLEKQLPEGKGLYFILAVYGLVTNLIAYFTLSQPELITSHHSLMVPLFLGLVICSLMATYGGWPRFIQPRKLAAYGYPLAVGYLFFLVTPMLLVLSGMKPILLSLLLINGFLSLFLLTPMLAASMALVGHAVTYLLTYKVGIRLDWSNYAVSELLLLLSFTLGAYYILRRYRKQIFELKEGIQVAWYSKKVYSERYQKLRRMQDDHHRDLMQGTSNGMERSLSSIALLTTQIEKKEKTSTMADTASQLDMQLQGSKRLLVDKVDHMGHYITMDYKNYAVKQLLDGMENHLQSLPEMAPIAYEHAGLQAEVVWDKDRLYSFVGDLLRNHFPKDSNIAFFISSHATQIAYADLEGRKEPAVALRIVQGIVENASKIAANYMHHTPEDHASYEKDLYRTVDAHYGVLERDKDGNFFTLVLPQDAKKVRPKIIDDKPPISFSAQQKMQLEEANSNFMIQLLAKARTEGRTVDIDRVKRAIRFMKRKHAHDLRKSGEPFPTHPLIVATKALDYTSEEDVIVGAILHDIVEDTTALAIDVENGFGIRVREMVMLVSSMHTKGSKKYKLKGKTDQARIIIECDNKDAQLIKLCDRLHNMETMDAMPPHEQQQKCAETRKYLIPVAKKLGFLKLAGRLIALCTQYDGLA
jgi:Na+/proline symporter